MRRSGRRAPHTDLRASAGAGPVPHLARAKTTHDTDTTLKSRGASRAQQTATPAMLAAGLPALAPPCRRRSGALRRAAARKAAICRAQGRGPLSEVGVASAAPRTDGIVEAEQRGVAAAAAASAFVERGVESDSFAQPEPSSRPEPNLLNPVEFVKDRLEADPRYLQKARATVLVCVGPWNVLSHQTARTSREASQQLGLP